MLKRHVDIARYPNKISTKCPCKSYVAIEGKSNRKDYHTTCYLCNKATTGVRSVYLLLEYKDHIFSEENPASKIAFCGPQQCFQQQPLCDQQVPSQSQLRFHTPEFSCAPISKNPAVSGLEISDVDEHLQHYGQELHRAGTTSVGVHLKVHYPN